jgi:hypothetical protein
MRSGVNWRRFLYSVLGGCVLLWGMGCARFPESDDDSKVVVWVGDYGITEEDLENQQTRLMPPDAPPLPEQQRIFAVNLLIDNVLLLQEAERQQIAEDPRFLKSVERFWQQSLIQELLQRKMQAIRDQIQITEQDIQSFYTGLKLEYRVRYVEALKSMPSPPGKWDELEIDNFLKSQSSYLVSDSGWLWSDVRDLDAGFRKQFLENKHEPGEVLQGVTDRPGTAALLCVAKSQEHPMESLEAMTEEIESLLRHEKERQLLEVWLRELRQDADVQYNRELSQSTLKDSGSRSGE